MQSKFYREKGKQIWQVDSDEIGPFLFSFDKKKIYNFWSDYWDLTDEQRKIFNREFPYMAELKDPENVVLPPEPEDDEEDTEEDYEYSD